MKNMILIDKLMHWYKKRHPEYVLNINQDLLDKNQKRVLLSYIKAPLQLNYDGASIFHPNKTRANQMITVLARGGYAVDVCDFDDMDVLPKLRERHYDAIIGFGPLYEAMCETKDIESRIIYITENDPRLVANKYQERKVYFRQRHPEVKMVPSSDRIQYYTARQFELSNKAIIMTSECNSADIRKTIPDFATIKCNGLINEQYHFSMKAISDRRNRFLWFGSRGFVQKGLDILIDVFRELPEYQMDIYGLPENETAQLKKLMNIPENVKFGRRISVDSKDFVELMNTHLFIISASCMEGMQSGVSTCMRHGLISLLTKECGYEDDSPVKLFNNYKVEDIISGIREVQKMTDDELAQWSRDIYEFAARNHTLKSFTERFESIIKEML